MRDEYRGHPNPLVFHAAGHPSQLHTVDSQVRTLEDLEGTGGARRLAAESLPMLETLGAVPVGMPVPQVYEALARGVVKGAWVPWDHHAGRFRLHEVTRYHTEAALGCTPFLLTMNKARYDGLPADVRRILDDTTGMELARRLGRIWQQDDQAGRGIALQTRASRDPACGGGARAVAGGHRARRGCLGWRRWDALGHDGTCPACRRARSDRQLRRCLGAVGHRARGLVTAWSGWPRAFCHGGAGCCWSPSSE